MDATDATGQLTGDAFAVQIKGGETYKASDGYRIAVHRDYWRDSVLPVIGVVHDPVDERLRWVNLTSALRAAPDLASVFVSETAFLDTAEQQEQLVESVRASLGDRLPVLSAGFGSISSRDQVDAVWEAFSLATRDAAALIAVRRIFLNLDHSARLAGLMAMAFCTPHPDIIWNEHNQLPTLVRDVVVASMRWSVQEVWQLLELVEDEEAFGRGTIGQTVYMLLRQDPGYLDKLLRVARIADDAAIATWAAGLAMQDASDPLRLWQSFSALRPDVVGSDVGTQIAAQLAEFGYVRVLD